MCVCARRLFETAAETLRGAKPHAERLLRVEARLDGAEPLSWLQAQRGWTQYYWGDRAGAFEMAGVGEARVAAPHGATDYEALFKELRAALAEDAPWLRWYGGFRFHDGPVKGERWARFAAYRFVVPRFEMRRGPDGLFLACNLLYPPGASAEALIEETREALATLVFPETVPELEAPQIVARQDAPDAAGWRQLVGQTLVALEQRDLEKIVLARESCFRLAEPVDPAGLLRRLRERAPGTFTFCFHPVRDRAFIGASPERLYRREGLRLDSEALAGTRPRGADAASDRALGEALLSSEKDLREHGFVVETVREHLAALCERVEVASRPGLMRLANVQHLHTPITATLSPELSQVDAALVSVLHPTPAVGGCPREGALAWIAAHEPFDRGIYAAPVGWVGADAAEFCVAIRSGLVQGDELTLYNGAGIVPGSSAEEEWAEIESKMGAFLMVLERG